MLISKVFNKTQVAFLYYKEKGKDYTTEAARKQFNQDKHIDKKLIRSIIKKELCKI